MTLIWAKIDSISLFDNQGYGNNFTDWTSFDPAIVSFRQFSFMNGPNQPGDMFLSAQQNQLNQQNLQQPGQGNVPSVSNWFWYATFKLNYFSTTLSGFGHHGINLQSSLMNQQQQQQQQPQPGNPQAQVNYEDIFFHHQQHHQQSHQLQQQEHLFHRHQQQQLLSSEQQQANRNLNDYLSILSYPLVSCPEWNCSSAAL